MSEEAAKDDWGKAAVVRDAFSVPRSWIGFSLVAILAAGGLILIALFGSWTPRARAMGDAMIGLPIFVVILVVCWRRRATSLQRGREVLAHLARLTPETSDSCFAEAVCLADSICASSVHRLRKETLDEQARRYHRTLPPIWITPASRGVVCAAERVDAFDVRADAFSGPWSLVFWRWAFACTGLMFGIGFASVYGSDDTSVDVWSVMGVVGGVGTVFSIAAYVRGMLFRVCVHNGVTTVRSLGRVVAEVKPGNAYLVCVRGSVEKDSVLTVSGDEFVPAMEWYVVLEGRRTYRFRSWALPRAPWAERALEAAKLGRVGPVLVCDSCRKLLTGAKAGDTCPLCKEPVALSFGPPEQEEDAKGA